MWPWNEFLRSCYLSHSFLMRMRVVLPPNWKETKIISGKLVFRKTFWHSFFSLSLCSTYCYCWVIVNIESDNIFVYYYSCDCMRLCLLINGIQPCRLQSLKICNRIEFISIEREKKKLRIRSNMLGIQLHINTKQRSKSFEMKIFIHICKWAGWSTIHTFYVLFSVIAQYQNSIETVQMNTSNTHKSFNNFSLRAIKQETKHRSEILVSTI